MTDERMTDKEFEKRLLLKKPQVEYAANANATVLVAGDLLLELISRYEASQTGKTAEKLAREVVVELYYSDLLDIPSIEYAKEGDYDKQKEKILAEATKYIMPILRPYLTQTVGGQPTEAQIEAAGEAMFVENRDADGGLTPYGFSAIIRRHLTGATATPNAKEQAGTFVVDKETCDKLLPLLEQLRENWPREITVIKNPATPKRVELLEGLLREVLELEKYPTHPMPNELFKRIDQALERIVNGLDKK